MRSSLGRFAQICLLTAACVGLLGLSVRCSRSSQSNPPGPVPNATVRSSQSNPPRPVPNATVLSGCPGLNEAVCFVEKCGALPASQTLDCDRTCKAYCAGAKSPWTLFTVCFGGAYDTCTDYCDGVRTLPVYYQCTSRCAELCPPVIAPTSPVGPRPPAVPVDPRPPAVDQNARNRCRQSCYDVKSRCAANCVAKQSDPFYASETRKCVERCTSTQDSCLARCG
jgi:hypothetical protein